MRKERGTKSRGLALREKRILGAALLLSNKNECQSITVDQIAQKARIAKGTIYYHFKSKDEIYARLVLDFNRAILPRLTGVDQNQTVVPRLKAVIGVFLESYILSKDYHRVLEYCGRNDFRENLSETIRKQFQELDEAFSAVFKALLSKGVEEGIFPRRSLSFSFYGLQSTLLGATKMVWTRELSDLAPKDSWEEIANYILTGITFASVVDRPPQVDTIQRGTSKWSTLSELVRVTGLDELYAEQDEIEREQYKAEFQRVIDGAKRKYKNDPISTVVESVAAKYSEVLLADLRSFDRVNLYTSLFGERFTESELTMVLDYYKSTVGQKDIQATKMIVKEVMIQSRVSRTTSLQKSLQGFRSEIEKVASNMKTSHAEYKSQLPRAR